MAVRESADCDGLVGEWEAGDDREYRATRVMFLGPDSYSLASSLPAQLGGATSTCRPGSGAIALLESSRGSDVLGVDLNPRATNFATFNSTLNGIATVNFVNGDLFEGVPTLASLRFHQRESTICADTRG